MKTAFGGIHASGAGPADFIAGHNKIYINEVSDRWFREYRSGVC